jgi:uncharacterized protein YbjT (DUF2867 family)
MASTLQDVSVVLVTGGTGTLGRPLVEDLRARGHEVRVLSRRAQHGVCVGDLASGVGVRAAVAGAELVVHCASDTRRLGRSDLEQTRNLIGASAGVRHLVYVSVVGVDLIPLGYYRRKLSCERELEGSGRPFTTLRCTQFHELIARLLRAAGRLRVAPLPLDFQFQPVGALDVAHRLCDVVTAEPTGGVAQFGGPEVLGLSEMVAAWRATHAGRPGAPWHLPVPGRVADAFRDGLNTCPDDAGGTQRWRDFVAA